LRAAWLSVKERGDALIAAAFALPRQVSGRGTKLSLCANTAPIDALDAAVATVDAQVESILGPFRTAVELVMTVPGIKNLSAQIIVSEIGTEMVAHNAGFDIAFLNAELKRAAKPTIATERLVDALMLARCKHPGGHNTSTTYVHAMAYIHCAVNMALCSTPNSGLTGSPDESGASRREKGLSRSGNERVRRILIQLSWRMQRFQLDGGLVRWFKTRTANSRRSRKPMIVALARKLVIALWRYVNTGMVPEGFKLAN